MATIDAMVLFDMIGDCDLSVPLEANSEPGALPACSPTRPRSAHDGDPAPFTGRTFPVSDDHVPFLKAGIPALDLIDFDYGPGPAPGAYWHTAADTLDKVCAESLDAVGERGAASRSREIR